MIFYNQRLEWVLANRYDYIEENSFCLDEDDPQEYYSADEAAEYIYKVSQEEEADLTLDQIQKILQTAHEYELTI